MSYANRYYIKSFKKSLYRISGTPYSSKLFLKIINNARRILISTPVSRVHTLFEVTCSKT